MIAAQEFQQTRNEQVHTTPKEVRIGHSKPQNAEIEQQISDDVISSEFHNQPTDRLESPSIEHIKSNVIELLRRNGGKLKVSRFERLYKVRFREKYFKALNVPDNGLKGSLRLRKVFEIHFTDITQVDTFWRRGTRCNNLFIVVRETSKKYDHICQYKNYKRKVDEFI